MNSVVLKFRTVSIFAVLLSPLSLRAQDGSGLPQTLEWTLPSKLAVIDSGSRVYHFNIDYNDASPTGEIVQRHRVSGEYTKGLPNNEVIWRNVGVATVSGAIASFPAPEKRLFMDGFRYRNSAGETMAPTFFKSFPATAFMERNLVWDTVMLESFAENYFDKLKLNVPFHVDAKDQDVHLPDLGTFRNHDIVLQWIGFSRRHGQTCAIIEYRAFFNPVIINTGVSMKARSDYWGEVLVSITSKQIESATLYEEVSGQITLPGATVAQPVNVFRIGSFEPVPSERSAGEP